MPRLSDTLPERFVDPLYRTRTYVDRRSGMPDPVRERRKLRERARQPAVNPGAAVQELVVAPTNATALEPGRIYRVKGGSGVADTFITRGKDASGNLVVVTLETV